ncbi:hypothetical protein, partial [Desulfocucumis palustris]|uniref:hypothetical protein n=1 Tax=Desulfocucumis palustris TaxID=1898651 RepID=UPI001A9A59D4
HALHLELFERPRAVVYQHGYCFFNVFFNTLLAQVLPYLCNGFSFSAIVWNIWFCGRGGFI